MKYRPQLCFMCFISLLFFIVSTKLTAQLHFQYPATPVNPVSDTLFGKVITDNYRWLEKADDPEVQTWLKTQADFTNNLLKKIPGRDTLFEAYKKLDQLNTVSITWTIRRGGRYFYTKTLKGENTGKLYYRQGEKGKEVLLFDPHVYTRQLNLSEEITFGFLPSYDGQKVALTITHSGKGDIHLVRFINVATKALYADSLYPVDALQTWTLDNQSVIYSELPTTNQLSTDFFLSEPLKMHHLGTEAKEDKIFVSRQTNPELGIQEKDFVGVAYAEDFKYLVLTIYQGPQGQVGRYYASAAAMAGKQIPWKLLTRPEDKVVSAVVYHEKAYLLTSKGASNFRLLMAPLSNPALADAKTIVPESGEVITDYLAATKDFLFIHKTDGINTIIYRYPFAGGAVTKMNVPVSGTLYVNPYDTQTNDCFLTSSSWNTPSSRQNFDAITGKVSNSSIFPIPHYPGIENLVVEEVQAKSYDGVMVPLSLVYLKGMQKDGKNIAYMEGYGSYGMSLTPYFKMLNLPLLERGVIIAVAHVRGGGEKGYAWQMGGLKDTKPNTWKDFIACAAYLVENKYTSPGHLIGEGTSAGGILIGRAITERPDLFAAAINNVPVSNPLRGENRPNGAMDAIEFGTVKDSAEAMGLMEMDACLHVKPGVKYPAVIAVGGINDTRVPVWQPAKLVAAMQTANASNRPILLMVNYDSGHWSDEKFVTYRNTANMLSLALWQAGHKDFQLNKE